MRGVRLLFLIALAMAHGPGPFAGADEPARKYRVVSPKDDGIIDWNWPALRVHNLIRGLHPWPHAFSFVQGKRVILRRSTIEPPGPKGPGLHTSNTTAGPAGLGPPMTDVGRVLSDPPGTILEADGDRLIVASGDGVLRILEIQAEGKRPMAVREFLAGHRLTAGERFTAAP